MLKRGFHGTYHLMTSKHLDRYVKEFVRRHNIRTQDTLIQMADIVRGTDRKRLTYAELIFRERNLENNRICDKMNV